jgi:hypothetical protein
VGAIPTWVSGHLYKNGFGYYEGKHFKLKFLFDVMAMLTKFTVKDGKATLSNRKLHSQYYNDSLTGIPPYRTFGGTDPEMNWWASRFSLSLSFLSLSLLFACLETETTLLLLLLPLLLLLLPQVAEDEDDGARHAGQPQRQRRAVR